MLDATHFQVELHGSIDTLQLAYAGYLGRFHGQTLKNYEHYLREYLIWCVQNGITPLAATRHDVEFYVRHLIDRGLAASTVNTAMTPVKGFYDFAHWDEYIDRDPARRVSLPKYSYKKSKRVTQREIIIFLETARDTGPRHWALVSLLCSMGMRIHEAAGLRIENYTGLSSGAPMIGYNEKGGNWRETPVPLPVFTALEEVRAGRTEGPMVPRRDGGQLSRAGAAGLIETVNRRATKRGLTRYVNPHLLRKTAVTTARDHGMSLADIQEFARHVDPRTTSRHYILERASSHSHPVHQVAALMAI